MSEAEPQTYSLGDDIDDYCSKCRGLSGHAVTAADGATVLKVMCRTCLSEHKYRKGKGGRSKERERQKLMDELLKTSPFRDRE